MTSPLSFVHTGDYSRRFRRERRQIVAEDGSDNSRQCWRGFTKPWRRKLEKKRVVEKTVINLHLAEDWNKTEANKY